MGRRGKPRGGANGGGGGRSGGSSGGGRAKPVNDDRFTNVPVTNDRFEAYYKAQKILPDEEWQGFMDKLHEPLPTTFRLTGSRELAPALNSMIERVLVPFLTGIEHEGVPLSPPRQLEWYPNGHAWQLNIARQAIRKNESFKKFQHFLVSETDAGNISRQEAVSMLPPLLLEVKPEHYVLDMCAAPGSKSAQLLESIHSLSGSSSNAPLPTGLLIANDSDAKRCHLLVHQSLHRIPAAEMMVTNHDATQLPGLRLPYDEGEPNPTGKKFKPLLFDRILADVPCSGDGTLRKNMGIWREWTVGNGAGLHGLQLRILQRGIALLKPGGRIVYSTCSMNPMENESVVSAALEAHPDMSLVNVTGSLPLLKRKPGLTTWVVHDSTGQPATKPAEDAPVQPHVKGQKKQWARTLWPNGKEEERNLNWCWRLYPHLMDTGGFFVAVLEKKGDSEDVEKVSDEAEVEVAVPEQDAVAETAHEESSESAEAKPASTKRNASPPPEAPEAKRAKVTEGTETPAEDSSTEVDFSALPAEIVGAAPTAARQGEFKEEPYIYLGEDDEEVKTCIDFFDLDPSFPKASLLVRNAQGKPLRSIYFTSPLVRTLLMANSYKRMRLISCGTKLFSRQGQDNGKDAGSYRCRWRLMNEGLSVLRPFMGPKRIVRANLETFKQLMQGMNVTLEEIKEEAFKKRIEEMEMGSCVLEVAAVGDQISTEQNLVLPFWRSKVSVNLMVEKVEKSALSNRLWGVDVTPHAPGPSKRDLRRAEEAKQAAAASEGGGEDSVEAVAAVETVEDSAELAEVAPSVAPEA